MTYVTKREVRQLSSPACHPRYTVTIPAGTRCAIVGNGFAVDDIAKVVGSNAHDLAHYYVWIDAKEIEEVGRGL